MLYFPLKQQNKLHKYESKRWNVPQKIKKDGSQMKNHLKRLGVKASDYKSVESYEKNQEQTKHYDLLTDIIEALNKNYVVVAGGNPDVPYDTEYKVNNKKTMVPIFN